MEEVEDLCHLEAEGGQEDLWHLEVEVVLEAL